ncbi:archaellar assembly protein FlaJ [Methanoplanus sp. FWC-SCC4]|uniref:Archaellar assembly protein FlaJ n=1 Tax=Methanochimaera problematica TaxID=2609417 RepID=A0AA97FCB9_9EURY|nr:archaellar assembly protein FlaJ [Methanoplanus sp. FWC-SCC4]WOF15618.1 archaellar assembly protein FlaJ [Methanoplanus sp. FWC-SCC4]
MFDTQLKNIREKNGGKLPFEDNIAELRNKISDIRDNKKMGNDLLFMITYMASITNANVSRPEIFAYTSERKEYIPARYIKRVECFVKRWNYSYAEGLRVVAERARNPLVESLLNRFGNSIESGVPDNIFLNEELGTVRNIFRNTFEQGVEMLKKWGDAYIALMLSATIVSIIIMVSVAIYAPDDLESTLNSSYFLTIGVSAFGIITMYKSIPDDQKCHNLSGSGSYEQNMVRKMERFIVPVTVLVSLILFISGINFGLICILSGILLAPLGIFGYRDDKNIIARDEDFTVFIRGLGSIMGGMGMTVTPALAKVDRKSLVVLQNFIDSVYSKMNIGLDEGLVWNKFIRDTGSNLIYKYLGIFRDSVELGAGPAEVAHIVSTSMLEQTLLRQKREMLSTGFIVLLIPMHMAMIGIFCFLFHILLTMAGAIKSVMTTFSDTASALSSSSTSIGGSMVGSINIFANFPEDKMQMFLVISILIVTVANILAGKIVKGGDRYMFYFFGSILFGLTGIIYITTPVFVDLMFSIPGFEAL